MLCKCAKFRASGYCNHVPPAGYTSAKDYEIHRPDVAAVDQRPVANGIEMGRAFAVGLTSGISRRKPEPMA